MHLVTATLSGLLFGLGLILSGMTDPAKVIGFLDLAGRWDPSLAFVMGGAVVVGMAGFRAMQGRSASLLDQPLRLPTARQIDRRLVLGGLTFGAGWGLAGYCPGPALASLLTLDPRPALFAAAMIAGMLIYEMLERRLRPRPAC
ncbi:MAG TPA: YeeE/YedE family protein [Burkholderiaceae bacterium]